MHSKTKYSNAKINSKNSGHDQTSFWASKSIPETITALGSNIDTGLTHAQVNEKLNLQGYNEVIEKKSSPILRFLRKFWGLSAWMLELIIILSAILGKYHDLVVVSVLLIVNAILSFIQESRATGVLDTLRKRLQISARVLRESSWQLIPARELVPGDIIRLRSGDIIPADIKLFTSELSVDQSALTGESLDVDKKIGDILSSGSIVRRGEGNGVVLLTGANTFFGRTTELVQLAKPKLHIEAVVAKMVQWLFIIVSVLILVVIVVSQNRGMPLVDILPLMLVLLMSAVPVALPVMFTVSMAIGSAELAKRGVLVTRLSASEDAAIMDILCVDKTGTITINQLAISSVIPLNNSIETDVLAAGALASEEANHDPIDFAFLAEARNKQVFSKLPLFAPVSFTPFDTLNRRTEAVFEQSGQRFRVMKGAVRTIAEACGVSNKDIVQLEERLRETTQKGARSLAVARGLENGPLELIGLVTLFDPLRPDAKQLIAELNSLGISVKMLTGDGLSVAQEIGHDLDLKNIHRVSDIKSSGVQTNEKSINLLEDADGLAEVYPEDKYTVVRQLQAGGHIVGMTGDGVNDAPALRQAEVGIAVKTATDVAKGAASVVLTDPGLIDIISLVEQGRSIYQRILTWIINKISRTILKAGFVAVAYLITGKFVVSAFAMLLMVLLNDSAKISLATDQVRPSRNPETWKIGGFITVSIVIGVAMVLESLALLGYCWSWFGLATNEGALHTFSFLIMLYMAVFSIISIRERRRFWASKPSKALAISLFLDALLGTLFAVVGMPGLTPLPWWQLLTVFSFAMVMGLVINDTIKVLLIRWLVPKAIENNLKI
jgi:plasma-membrane proton-efflux P-type ATPase